MIDFAILKAGYGAHLSDVAADLLSDGLPVELLTNVMRLVMWEIHRE